MVLRFKLFEPFQVYGLALPQSELIRTLHKYTRMAQILLISIAVIMFISVLGFVRRVLNAAVVEMGLRNALNKQMEATRQAERKSINKSLAFARASHDIRAPLAGLSGLIEISYGEVARGSELETNLRQMESCTNDLLGKYAINHSFSSDIQIVITVILVIFSCSLTYLE